jgi:hypothetical protein
MSSANLSDLVRALDHALYDQALWQFYGHDGEIRSLTITLRLDQNPVIRIGHSGDGARARLAFPVAELTPLCEHVNGFMREMGDPERTACARERDHKGKHRNRYGMEV